jgi:aryl-alcohol dehydrogenase-like predicted oxidoreductase
MAIITLGKTGLQVERMGFGALPIQRITKDEAVRLLRRAHDGGINYFDTARAYSDSEEKLGAAFAGKWDEVIIATKTMAQTGAQLEQELETSLRTLGTDHIDVYQLHNPPSCPRPGDENGLYDAALRAQQAGKIRFIGITNHSVAVAREAVESGLYATLQYPFSYLSTDEELALAPLCAEKGMGMIAMKALAGGLLTNSAAACAWMLTQPNVVPIWGMQRERELDEFLSYIRTPPVLTEELQAVIAHDRAELQGEFCRGCGYCMPCPQGIVISQCARSSLMLRRAPTAIMLSDEGHQMMEQIKNCVNCGQCKAKCPYGLDTPTLLRHNYEDYLAVLQDPTLIQRPLTQK